MPISFGQRILKRAFDIIFSTVGLFLTWWIIAVAYVLASIDTNANGFFIQERVGKNGNLFRIIKIRTMRNDDSYITCVTTDCDPRITRLGCFFRKTRIDELPQLINVFLGQMSFVGPRPDVLGFADELTAGDRIILSVRPGITGPATLAFRYEEEILGKQDKPEEYNREVIFPSKVRLNREYVKQYSFLMDLKYMLKTVFNC
jgi:lipopolysaccharide/colanic/teichoic acid biosynthesis glycosyltransferase